MSKNYPGIDEGDEDVSQTVELKDNDGRSLMCYVERTLEVEGTEYLLLMPVDSPIEIFAWEADEDDDEEEALVDVEEDEIDSIFATAQAVLAEHDLKLQRTAYTLTASGELPDPEEDDVITLDLGEDDDGQDPDASEQFQMLCSFFHEEQEYAVCTPFEPLLFFARKSTQGHPELLSPEDFQEVRSRLEDQLFDELE